jgi:hypothetical protein
MPLVDGVVEALALEDVAEVAAARCEEEALVSRCFVVK